MTKADFCLAAAEELYATHPELPAAAVRVFLGHAHDLLLDAFGTQELSEGDLALCEELTCWRCARLGSEGLAAEGYSGVSQSFADDLPVPLRRAIGRRRKVRWA